MIDRMANWLRSLDKTQIVIIVLLLIHLIPVWAFKFIPTQDGLNHVYNAYILKEYNNPEYTKYREVYDLNIKFSPNWSAHAFFFVMLHIMPPLVAEKLYVTLCIALLPLSLFYFLRAVDKRLMFFGFLGFLYSYNYLLNMGFYGFALSVPVYFFTLGYWWKHRNDLNVTRIAVLYFLVILTYFCHLFSYGVILLSLSLLALTTAILPADPPCSIIERFKELLKFAGFILPVNFILLIVFLANPESREVIYHTDLWGFFVSVRALVSFNDDYIPISWGLLGFVGVCFLWTLAKDRIIGKRFINQRDGFLLLFIVMTVLYFKIPWQIGPPAWFNDRLNLYLFPVLLAWFSFKYPGWLKQGLAVVMVGLSIAHLGLTFRDYHLLNKDMKEFTSGAHLIAPNSAISTMSNDWANGDWHGPIKYMSPFYHDTCYYGLGNGGLYIGNYEPKYSYFPLQYKNGNWKFQYTGPIIDYMLVWRMDENSDEVQQIKNDYELIHETKNLKLFRHKLSGK